MPSDPTRSVEIEKLVTALAQAQAEIKSPERNRTVNVTPRSGGTGYSFSYATLDHIIEAIRGPLTKNGLWFTQILREDGGTYILDTRLLHNSGQWLACQTPLLFEGGGNQQFGSALTFMKRYALTSLLGIAAEEDDDANAADGNTVNQVQDRKPLPPKPDVIVTNDKPPARPQDIAPYKLEVGLTADQSGSDWVGFGKLLIAFIKAAPSAEVAQQWREVNQDALSEMEKAAAKTYTNLSMSIIKAINEKSNA